jgi:F0F1-type ATP synthase membrane subunit b/b'
MLDVHTWEAIGSVLFLLVAFRPIKNLISKHIKIYQEEVANELNEAQKALKKSKEIFQEAKELYHQEMQRSKKANKFAEETMNSILQESENKFAELKLSEVKANKERIIFLEKVAAEKLHKDTILKAVNIAKNYIIDNAASFEDGNEFIEQIKNLNVQNVKLY